MVVTLPLLIISSLFYLSILVPLAITETCTSIDNACSNGLIRYSATVSQPSCFSVDGGTAPTGYANVTVYWYDTLHCVASSLTLESDDAGSGKGHNFCTSVVVRSGFPRKFEGARLLVCRLGRIKTSVDQM